MRLVLKLDLNNSVQLVRLVGSRLGCEKGLQVNLRGAKERLLSSLGRLLLTLAYISMASSSQVKEQHLAPSSPSFFNFLWQQSKALRMRDSWSVSGRRLVAKYTSAVNLVGCGLLICVEEKYFQECLRYLGDGSKALQIIFVSFVLLSIDTYPILGGI